MRIERNEQFVSWTDVARLFSDVGWGVRSLYKRLGWRKQATAMILPRSEEQALLNCPADDK